MLNPTAYKVMTDLEMSPKKPGMCFFGRPVGDVSKHKIMEARCMFSLIEMGASRHGMEYMTWFDIQSHPNFKGKGQRIRVNAKKEAIMDQIVMFPIPDWTPFKIEFDTGSADKGNKLATHFADDMTIDTNRTYLDLGIPRPYYMYVFHSLRSMEEAMKQFAKQFPKGHPRFLFLPVR